MTAVKGVIREIGPSRTTRVSARRWYGSSTIVVQSEETGQTYSVRVSAKTMDRCRFLPRVGMRIVVHGFVEEAEFGLSDFVVSRVTRIKREGSDVKRIYRFDED